jgi:hypothetical protein
LGLQPFDFLGASAENVRGLTPSFRYRRSTDPQIYGGTRPKLGHSGELDKAGPGPFATTAMCAKRSAGVDVERSIGIRDGRGRGRIAVVRRPPQGGRVAWAADVSAGWYVDDAFRPILRGIFLALKRRVVPDTMVQ